MTDDEYRIVLQEVLNVYKINNSLSINVRNNFKDLYHWIIDNTAVYKPRSFTESVYIILNGPYIPCRLFGPKPTFISFNKGYRKYCGKECGCMKEDHVNLSTINQHKLTTDEKNKIRDKRANTCIKKYGTAYPSQLSKFKEKQRLTNLINNGVEYPFQSKIVREKYKQNSINNYGVENPGQREEVKEKRKVTNLTKYGVPHQNQRFIDKDTLYILKTKDVFSLVASDKTIHQISIALNVSVSTVIQHVNKYNLRDSIVWNNGSSYEDKVKTFLQTLGVHFVQHSRSIIAPLELDFYLPDHKLAIEVGSAYFHSEISGGKDRKYHYTKWVKCNEQGITLLQYFDNDVLNNWHLIESKIKRLIKQPIPIVGARKLTIRELTDYNLESEFLEAFHLQGAVSKRNLVLSAYYNDNLVGITSWLLNKNTCELVRYATDISNVYPGLFSKMLKNFCRLTKFNGTLISFSDNRHSNGGLYKSMGFTLDSVSNPGYLYTRDFINFESRIVYQKHKLKDKFKLLESNLASSTEWSIMQSQGYDRLWDAGQSKWVMQITG